MRARIVVGVGGSATTDGGLARGRGARLVARRGAESRSRATSTTPFLDAARVFGPQKGATDAQVELLTRRLAQPRRISTSSAPASTSASSTGAGAAGGLAGGLAAIGARARARLRRRRQARRASRSALDGVDLVVTGEGRLDVTSFEGKVVGGVLEWAADARRRRTRASSRVRSPTTRATSCRVHRRVVLALTDRVLAAGEAFARAAVLVEEAALEAGRAARRA